MAKGKFKAFIKMPQEDMRGDLYFVLEYRGRKTTGLNILLPHSFILHDCTRISETTNEKTSKKCSIKIKINFKFFLKNIYNGLQHAVTPFKLVKKDVNSL